LRRAASGNASAQDRRGGAADPYASERDLRQRPKSDAAKLNLAARLRRETTLTIRQIAERLHLGSWKSLNNKLYLRSRGKGKRYEV